MNNAECHDYIIGFNPISGILDDVSLGQENTLSCQVDAFPPSSDIRWLDSQVFFK